jgi:hypothetical protein
MAKKWRDFVGGQRLQVGEGEERFHVFRRQPCQGKLNVMKYMKIPIEEGGS